MCTPLSSLDMVETLKEKTLTTVNTKKDPGSLLWEG